MAIPQRQVIWDKSVYRWSKKHDLNARANGYDSWQAWIDEFEAELGREICGAMRKNAGKGPGPCRERPTPGGNGRCKRWHNGLAARGAALPTYKHGRYSAFVPKGWRGEFERLRSKRDALDSLYELLALGETEIIDVLQGITPNMLNRIRRAVARMHRYHGQNDEAFTEAWQELDLLLDRGTTHVDGLKELRKSAEHIRKLAHTINQAERDQLKKLGIDELESLEMFVVDIIRRALTEEVDDTGLRHRLIMRIATDIDTAARTKPDNLLPSPDEESEGRELVVGE